MNNINTTIMRLRLRTAGIVLIMIPALFLVFHGLILAGVLPRTIVWGGRLTDTTFVPLELLAITLNLLLMLVGAVAAKVITAPALRTVAKRVTWFLFYFVVIITVLGLFSTTTIEVLMTPVTALYGLCLYRIARFSED